VTTPTTWVKAKEHCELWDGRLASVHSTADNARLTGSTMDIFGSYWLGLNNIKKTGLEWTDNSVFKYSNWE
jgi:hypothetical protein